MTEQLAFVRATDPDTSWEAAHRVSKGLNETQERIYSLLKMYGPMHDEALADKYREVYGPITEQSVRSRRSELRDKRKVSFSGDKTVTRNGGPTRIWRAV